MKTEERKYKFHKYKIILLISMKKEEVIEMGVNRRSDYEGKGN
ncbi:MAG: hypothetical protein R2788_25755 [Saprospiraceae bacterium]